MMLRLAKYPQGGEEHGAYDLRGRKIIFLVTEDWYFCSHRLPIARAARDAGAEVVVATRVERHRDAIESEGFRLVELPWRRNSRNLAAELRALWLLVKLYRRERADIVHHVAVKAAVYGGIASLLGGHPPQVNAIAGMGYVSTSSQLRARLLRPVVRSVFRRVLNRPESAVIVQNPDDASALTSAGLFSPARVHLIRGSGVDVERFHPATPAEGPVRAVLAGRMLRSKGVEEAVAAARILAERGCDARLVLVGDPDPENPESIDAGLLRGWAREGLVEWIPQVDDMVPVWRGAHVGLLPSYREGLPMSLLEAAACGLPLVATDVPGCREVVAEGENGLLVPARDERSLADAIERLAGDAELRRRMGQESRARAEEHFAQGIVVKQTLELYRGMVR
jgi:glycosyltransferase involved in cell wall biosynthesis